MLLNELSPQDLSNNSLTDLSLRRRGRRDVLDYFGGLDVRILRFFGA